MSSSKGTGPGGDLSKIQSEIAEIRGELKAVGDSLRALQVRVGSPALYDGTVTTPDPGQTAHYTPGQDLQIVLQFVIPGDAGLFLTGAINYVDDDGTQVQWSQDPRVVANINLLANTVTFSVTTPALYKTGPAKPGKSPKKLAKPARKLYTGTGTGTVIHTKNLILFQSQFISSGTLYLQPGP